jgi:exosortase
MITPTTARTATVASGSHSWRAWFPLATISALLLICYSPMLYHMAGVWIEDDNMSHGLFVPIAAAYIAWTKRDLLEQIKPKVNYWGLPLVLFGFMTLCIGPPSLPTWVFIVRCSFLFSLVGCILFLGGTAVLRALTFPLLLLPLMIPFPFYDQLTLPLQFIASMLAENFLSIMGYSVLREGNVLYLPTQALNVAEACSGLRSIYALTFLTLTYSYFFTPRTRARWILAAAILPVAILVNALRVALTAIIGMYKPAWTEGTYHEMLGWSVFVFAFAILLGLNAILKKIPHLAGPLPAGN